MNRTILIAEDDHLLAKAYSLTFPQKGIEVRLARNGVQTLEMLTQSAPDLLLLDLLMPEMNGIEVLEALQGRMTYPVLVFTNMSKESSRRRCFELGAKEYLIKCKLSLEELVLHVTRHLSA